MQYKIHYIRQGKKGTAVGVTIPKDIFSFFGMDTRFFIEKSGSQIILSSGANIFPTEEEVKNYKFEDVKIREEQEVIE